MAGPISFFTSNLVRVTEYSLTPNDNDTNIVWGLKKGTIGVVKGLDALVQLIERVIGFLYEKGKEIYNSDKFQNGKRVVIDHATIAKDYVVDHATRFYQMISALQRPAAIQQPN